MGIVEILIIGIGLAMDAFAVSICKGLATRKLQIKHILCVGLWFGGFQALMPVIGYLLGTTFTKYITEYDHWIAFVLLAFIGANMIKEAFDKDEKVVEDYSVKTMLIMAIATSIDALAVGVTFAFFNVNIVLAVSIIGIITFCVSALGIKIGNHFGDKYKSKAELAGGIILICLGAKILIEHILF